MTKIGIHENYQGVTATTFAKTASRFPLVNATREFEGGVLIPQDLVKRVVARCQMVWDAGKTAVWSFKPNPADVTSSAWKPYVIKLGQYIKDNHLQDKVVIVVWHEPENDVPTYFKNSAAFVALFNTVHEWLMSVDPTIVTSHAALGYYYRNITGAQAREWVTKATVQSIDFYSGRSFPLAMTLGAAPAFKVWKASRPAGSPWGVSERGWIATAELSDDRARAIRAESDWFAGLPRTDYPVFYVVWNTEGVENDPTIILDAAGAAAINTMFGRLTALAGTPDPGPAPTVPCPLCTGTGKVEPGTYVIVRAGG
jgi:hypothetical protein